VVDLNITQELSSFVVTTTGVNNSPTLMQRSATSTLGIKPGEVVLFAGLEETHEDETNARFFGFNIGKKTNDSTSELLLLIEAQKI
jgi:general secretion pathway protein D